MNEKYLTPAAILAQSILNSIANKHTDLSVDVIASAFRTAYDAVEKAELGKFNEGLDENVLHALTS